MDTDSPQTGSPAAGVAQMLLLEMQALTQMLSQTTVLATEVVAQAMASIISQPLWSDVPVGEAAAGGPTWQVRYWMTASPAWPDCSEMRKVSPE